MLSASNRASHRCPTRRASSIQLISENRSAPGDRPLLSALLLVVRAQISPGSTLFAQRRLLSAREERETICPAPVARGSTARTAHAPLAGRRTRAHKGGNARRRFLLRLPSLKSPHVRTRSGPSSMLAQVRCQPSGVAVPIPTRYGSAASLVSRSPDGPRAGVIGIHDYLTG